MYLNAKFLAYFALIWAAGTSATAPQSCQVKVFINGYPSALCVVPSVAGQDSLISNLYLANGECKDTTVPVASFRHAITNDAFASRCLLSYWTQKGCKGAQPPVQARVESDFNSCVSSAPLVAVPDLTGAASFLLACK